MPDCSPEQVRQSLEVLYRSDSGRILATLVRLLQDLDLSEDAMQEAFSAALNDTPPIPASDEHLMLAFSKGSTYGRRPAFPKIRDPG